MANIMTLNEFPSVVLVGCPEVTVPVRVALNMTSFKIGWTNLTLLDNFSDATLAPNIKNQSSSVVFNIVPIVSFRTILSTDFIHLAV